ncbi:MAG TPA: hypothetical protein VFV75_12920 [Candidatus Polarisedimenticolaceae bacterium]|nr:hypothetical protein [Candidatus Polarisedimenticolaceae bacterium]
MPSGRAQRPDTVSPDATTVDAVALGYSYGAPLLHEAESAIGASLKPVYGARSRIL